MSTAVGRAASGVTAAYGHTQSSRVDAHTHTQSQRDVYAAAWLQVLCVSLLGGDDLSRGFSSQPSRRDVTPFAGPRGGNAHAGHVVFTRWKCDRDVTEGETSTVGRTYKESLWREKVAEVVLE